MDVSLVARLLGQAEVGAALLLALLGPIRAVEPAERPPNIVLLYADDWRHDTLGCAGNVTVRTPHLDRLAAQGVRFSDARVTTAICGVSRASLLTGQWMSRHGNRSFGAFSTPWEETLPGLLRAHGYWTGHVGKWHCGKFPAERFDVGKAYSGVHWIRRPDGSEVHVTAQNEADALEFLRTRPAERPFFLTVAFFAPHAEDGHAEQYRPQPRSAEWYEGVTIPVPSTATPAHTAKLPPFLADPRNEGRRRWALRFDTPEKYQRMMTDYYRLCSEVDAACGAIMAELERLGLAGDTLVLFTGDNGYFHGEKGLADKWYPYEESIRVPLIIRDPRAPEALQGSTSAALALNVDLAPTLLAAAGVDAPKKMQGRDLTPWLRGVAVADWRTEYFYEHPVIRSVDFIPSSEALVTRGLKYIRWPDHPATDHPAAGHDVPGQVVEELFDLTTDPHEERDLSADPARSTLLVDLRGRLAAARAGAR